MFLRDEIVLVRLPMNKTTEGLADIADVAGATLLLDVAAPVI